MASGTASLNWSADSPITAVELSCLTGEIPEHGRPVRTSTVGALWVQPIERERFRRSWAASSNLNGACGSGDNQLTGEIPPELGDLSNLTKPVPLRSNQLMGEIPPELGGLSNLDSCGFTHTS